MLLLDAVATVSRHPILLLSFVFTSSPPLRRRSHCLPLLLLLLLLYLQHNTKLLIIHDQLELQRFRGDPAEVADTEFCQLQLKLLTEPLADAVAKFKVANTDVKNLKKLMTTASMGTSAGVVQSQLDKSLATEKNCKVRLHTTP